MLTLMVAHWLSPCSSIAGATDAKPFRDSIVAAVDGRIPMIADYSSIYRLYRTGSL